MQLTSQYSAGRQPFACAIAVKFPPVLLFSLLLLPVASEAQVRQVHLAFNEYSTKRSVLCYEGNHIGTPIEFAAYDWDEVGEEEYEPYSVQAIENITLSLASIYGAAGVTNIEFVTERPPSPAVTVHFQGWRNCLKGTAVNDVDQFDANPFGDRVVIFKQQENDNPIEDVIRVTAHEIGHALGLRHMKFPSYLDPKRESIMETGNRDGACATPACVDRFINFPAPVDNLVFDETSNPVYHLRRWVNGESDKALQDAGVCPGPEWDLTTSEALLLRLKMSLIWGIPDRVESPLALPGYIYDVRFLVDEGGDSLNQVAFFAEVSTNQPLVFDVLIPEGRGFQVFASTVPGQPPDLLLIGEGGLNDGVDLFAAANGILPLQLVLPQGDGTFESFAGADAEGKPEEVFVSGFESDSLPANLAQPLAVGNPCFPALTLVKEGEGKGSVISEPEGINCDENCTSESQAYYMGDRVKLTATAANGSEFVKWADTSDACSNSTNPVCEVTMDSDKTAKAVFEESPNNVFFAENLVEISGTATRDDFFGLCTWDIQTNLEGQPFSRAQVSLDTNEAELMVVVDYIITSGESCTLNGGELISPKIPIELTDKLFSGSVQDQDRWIWSVEGEVLDGGVEVKYSGVHPDNGFGFTGTFESNTVVLPPQS